MKRLSLHTFGKRAALAVLVLVALDVVATSLTLAAGAKWLHR